MNPLFRYTVLALVLFPLQITAYKNGLVTAACVDMKPQHESTTAQTGTVPYTLTASKTTYMAGEQITVTLKNTTQEYPIEGFLIQARQPGTTTPLGTFQTSGSEIQNLTCTTAASAVSHTSDSEKSSVEVTWIAPNSSFPNIEFRATVVRNLSIYWINIAGSSLTYAGGSQLTAPLCMTYLSMLFTILLTFTSRF